MRACIICGKSPTEKRLVKVHNKVTQALLKASKLRGDKHREKLLRGSDPVSIHNQCYNQYINRAVLSRIVHRRQFLQDMPALRMSSVPSPKLENFDFSKKCFICAETIPDDFETGNQDQGMIVHSVKTFSELKKVILPYLENRCDQNSQEIVERIGMVSDAATAGAKYHRKCIAQLTDSASKRLKRAHFCQGIDGAMKSISSYLTGSKNCLFKISHLVDLIDPDHRPDLFTVKSHLLKKYGAKIKVFDYHGDDAFVCFRETGGYFPQTRCVERIVDKKEERLSVVKKAAAIILEDIESLSSKECAYPPLEDFMKNVDSVVPESLRIFLSEVVMKPKLGFFDNWERKCTAIAHAIMSAVRPKTFFSTLQMGVAGYFYKQFASKQVIDLLSALGFCSSYEKVLAFEFLSNRREQPSASDRGFSQLELNDVDSDVNTCNKHETIYEIGEIHYVTPSDLVEPKHSTPPTLKKQSEPASQTVTTVLVRDNPQPKSKLTNNLFAANLDGIRPISYNIQPTINDFMWLLAKRSHVPNVSEWDGFVKERKTNKNFVTSRILRVNSLSSSDDTIRNVLFTAVEKCKAANQSSCVLTFDLQLYISAHTMINAANPDSPIKHIILRLGGFPLIITFLGSIGYIMAGSGLEDLFKIIFPGENVKNIISGTVFAKAIQAHVLTHLVLAKQIINSIELTDDEREEIDFITGDTERSDVLTPANEIVIKNIAAKFADESRKIEARGPTAKLWIQYFRMVTLVKQFIEAERSGDWDLHLDTMQRILPYLHASGKLLYAQAVHIYIQNMIDLQQNIPSREYKQFTKNGYYMIRRTHRFWSSITPDVTIEQLLMRTMKMARVAGRKHGKFENVLNRWRMGLIFLQKVCEKVENFCGVSNDNAKENVGMQSSGIHNEDDDVGKIDEWFVKHPPFPRETELRSISTGVVGDSSINCHLSGEIGITMISRLVGLSFDFATTKPAEMVVPLATVTSGIKIDTVPMPIDPLLIFQRMCIAKEAHKDLEAHLMYELAPYPLTLFTERGMLRGNKSSMYDCFSSLPNDCLQSFNTVLVVDGGYLLRCVGWDINLPFSDICKKYTKYVRENFGMTATIIFDLHPDNVHDSPENAGSSNEILSANTVITKETICVISREEFLANKGNKALFIDMLKTELEQIGCLVKQCMAHASILIVHRAIQIATKLKAVVIVSENVDILVLLVGLKPHSNNIYFRRPGNGSIPEQIYTPKCLKYSRSVRDNILFLHAFSGCNTTSAVYDMEKDKFLSTFEKNEKDLRGAARLFKIKTIDPGSIAAVGERFFIALYGGGRSVSSINALRFKLFGELANKNKLSPTALPPTKSAVRQHSLRTYHQVQAWLGIDHSPERWGWKKTSCGLRPVRNTIVPVPENLLRLISCKCMNNCVNGCACCQAGLRCSILCSNCSRQVCENKPNVIDILKDNDNDIDDERSEEIHRQNTAEEYEVIEDRVTKIEGNKQTSS